MKHSLREFGILNLFVCVFVYLSEQCTYIPPRVFGLFLCAIAIVCSAHIRHVLVIKKVCLSVGDILICGTFSLHATTQAKALH